MGGSSSKDSDSESDLVMLLVRVRSDRITPAEARKPMTKAVDGREKTVELVLAPRTTFSEVKKILQNQHHVFSDISIDAWELSISGMDGQPKMFSFPNGFGVPDSNAYLCEVGIELVAELVAFVPKEEYD